MKESVICNINVMPVGSGTSLSRYVREVVAAIRKAPGVKYQVHAMGTVVEGPLSRVLELAQQIHEIPFGMGAGRVVTSITIDDRRDKAITIESKVKAVS